MEPNETTDQPDQTADGTEEPPDGVADCGDPDDVDELEDAGGEISGDGSGEALPPIEGQ